MERSNPNRGYDSFLSYYLTGNQTQPRLGFLSFAIFSPQGSREARQPWAELRNRVAVKEEDEKQSGSLVSVVSSACCNGSGVFGLSILRHWAEH
jgi:hypothetical protein